MKTIILYDMPRADKIAAAIAQTLLAYKDRNDKPQFFRTEIPGGFEIAGILKGEQHQQIVFRYISSNDKQQFELLERLFTINQE